MYTPYFRDVAVGEMFTPSAYNHYELLPWTFLTLPEQVGTYLQPTSISGG